jgi:hypothetical protein
MDLSSPLCTLPMALHIYKDFYILLIRYYKKQADPKNRFYSMPSNCFILIVEILLLVFKMLLIS